MCARAKVGLRAKEKIAMIARPDGCICTEFKDTGGFRIADLTCPVHGVNGTNPGDGYWDKEDGDE